MNKKTKDKWEKHYSSSVNEFPAAIEVLTQNQYLLPRQGRALDLACGRGANAICLAEYGLNVSAWDISSSALNALSLQAKIKSLNIDIDIRDVSAQPPEPETFDVIVVSHFLDRDLISQIKNAIKQNGLIFYQTFIKNKVKDVGPNNPDYLLTENELLNFFNDWKIIFYREEGTIGDINAGFRNQAMLIAQKA